MQLCGCDSHIEAPAEESLQQIMDTVVDPAADAIWDAVGSTVTREGTAMRQPVNDAEWDVLRVHAKALINASSKLSLDGLSVAVVPLAAPAPDVLSSSEIEKEITADPTSFRRRALALREAAIFAVEAIDARDSERLVDAGGRLDEACENCHKQFWYPRAKWPPLPARINLEPRH